MIVKESGLPSASPAGAVMGEGWAVSCPQATSILLRVSRQNKNAMVIGGNLKYPHFLQDKVRNRMTSPEKVWGAARSKYLWTWT